MVTRLSFDQIDRLVSRRASELSMSEELLLRNLTKEARKELVATMSDLEKLWKQGKLVQRRAQTVLQPLMWQAETGIEPDKIDIGTATEPDELIQPGFTPQWNRLLNVAATSLLGAVQIHGRLTEGQHMAALQLPLTSLFIYASSRRFGTPSVFDLRNNLAEKLVLTDADQIRPRDVQPPLPGFYVQVPPGALELMNRETGWHKVSFVGNAEAMVAGGPRKGRLITSLFWCEPNENSTSATDDNAQVSFVSLPDDYDGTVEEYEATIRDDPENHHDMGRSFVRWQGEELSFRDGHRLLRRFVINFCLYLSSPNPDIQPTGGKQTWKDVVEKSEAAHNAGPHAKRQVTVGKNFSLWDVGRNVHRLHKLTATDILVRGHWRRQAHGVGRSLRRVIWVEPFVRRPTGGEAAGHEYAVEDEKEIKSNPDIVDLAKRLAVRLRPSLGMALASEVANNVAQIFMDDEMEEPLVVVVRDVLMHRKRHPSAYQSGHLTDELIDEALTAIEDMTP